MKIFIITKIIEAVTHLTFTSAHTSVQYDVTLNNDENMDVLRMDWQMGERHVPPSREPLWNQQV